MAPVENNTWTHEGLWQDGAYQHQQSQIYSYSAQDVRTSLAAAPPYQLGGVGGFSSSQPFSNTPRYISDDTFIQQPHMQEYEHELQYTTAGANHNYRENSGSGTSYNYGHIKSASNSPGLAHYQVAANTHYVSTFLGQGESYDETSIAHDDSNFSTFGYTEDETHEDAAHEQDATEGGRVNKASSSKEKSPCTHAECLGDDGEPKRFFSRKADVVRHHKSQHNVTLLDCPWPKCTRKGSRGFARLDHLTEHRRGYHGESIAKRSGGNNSERRPTSNAGPSGVAQSMSTGAVSASSSASASLSPSFDATSTMNGVGMSDGNLGQLQTYHQNRDIAACKRTVARKRATSHKGVDADQESISNPARISDASKHRMKPRLVVTARTSKDLTQRELEQLSTDQRSYYQTSQQPPQQSLPQPQYHGRSQGENRSMMYEPQTQTQTQTQTQNRAQYHSGSNISTVSPSLYPQNHEVERYTEPPQMPPRDFQYQHRPRRSQFK